MRGQSNTILTIIFLSIVMLSIIPFTLMLLTQISHRPTIEESVARRSTGISMGVGTGAINATAYQYYGDGSTYIDLSVFNRLGENVSISYIFTNMKCRYKTYMIDITKNFTSSCGTTIPSGGVCRATINITKIVPICGVGAEVQGVYIVTSLGTISIAKMIRERDIESIYSGYIQPATRILQVIPIQIDRNELLWDPRILLRKGFQLATLDSIINPTKVLIQQSDDLLNPGGAQGMQGRNSAWVLKDSKDSISLSISNQLARSLWVLKDPRDPKKYIIMITSDSPMTISIGGTSSTYCIGSQGIRVKIYGFISSNPSGIAYITGDRYRFGSGVWIRNVSQNVAEYMFLGNTSSGTVTLSGIADRIEIYCRDTSKSSSSYVPYLLLGVNKEVTGYAGILFTTEDRGYGWRNTYNEYFYSTSGTPYLQDWSDKSLVLVYNGVVLMNGDKPSCSGNMCNASSIAIMINYAFHHNEYDDENGVSIDMPIMIVGLVDDDGNIVVRRDYTFRELTRYEYTYPPIAQLQSSVVFIPIPPYSVVGLKKFYVFIAIQDPYSYNGYLDDLDLTLYIDNLSILIYS